MGARRNPARRPPQNSRTPLARARFPPDGEFAHMGVIVIANAARSVPNSTRVEDMVGRGPFAAHAYPIEFGAARRRHET